MPKTKTNTKDRTCDKCGALATERAYTEDSFEYCEKWTCKMLKKTISDYVDWNEHNISALPNCPLIQKTPIRKANTPKEKINEHYKFKYTKAMKENKELRKKLTQVTRKLNKINEMSGSK